jgi:hypothetical protein
MTGQQEPEFLTRDIVDAIHEDQIDSFGGLHGVRDENALESAIAAATSTKLLPPMLTIWRRVRPILGCGIDTSRLPEQQTYELMMKGHEAGRNHMADYQ